MSAFEEVTRLVEDSTKLGDRLSALLPSLRAELDSVPADAHAKLTQVTGLPGLSDEPEHGSINAMQAYVGSLKTVADRAATPFRRVAQVLLAHHLQHSPKGSALILPALLPDNAVIFFHYHGVRYTAIDLTRLALDDPLRTLVREDMCYRLSGSSCLVCGREDNVKDFYAKADVINLTLSFAQGQRVTDEKEKMEKERAEAAAKARAQSTLPTRDELLRNFREVFGAAAAPSGS